MDNQGGTTGVAEPAAEMETRSDDLVYVYERGAKIFWKKLNDEVWVDLGERHLRTDLAKREGLSERADAKAGQSVSPLDDRVLGIVERDRVDFALALPGFKPGVHTVQGWRVLVPRALPLVTPMRGEWPVIRALVEGMFQPVKVPLPEGGERVVEQKEFFYAWLQHWLRQLYAGRVGRGLCLVVAGDRECGKSLLLGKVVKALTGGRAAKPYDYLIGRDNFNRKMFEASLQLIDDENADTSGPARREFGARIKMFTSNDEMSMRAMNRDGVDIDANLRLVVLLNNEGEALLVLPEMSNHISDKMLMLLATKRPKPAETASEGERAAWPMPMPTRTDAEKDAFAAAMRRELPAFAHWLLHEYETPETVTGGRLGVKHWHHPELIYELGQFAKYVRLWQLIHRSGVIFKKNIGGGGTTAEWVDCDEWRGDADALEQALRSSDSKLRKDEIDELPSRTWIGQRLKEAALAWGPTACTQARTGKERTWVIKRRPDLC